MERTECWGTMPERLAAAGGDASAAADSLLDALTEREVLRLTSGSRHLHQEAAAALTGRYNFVPIPGADIPRLGVPGVRFSDGPRGIVVGHSTAFPCTMARGATFDPHLEARVGHAIGRELTAQGANFFGGVCVNLLRHPAWGRAQETYGEDSLLLGEMGAALTQSVGAHGATCVKHYACNSVENSRFRVDVRIAESDLRDLYLPHFERCVRAGVDCVMSSYNKVNGEWCGHHRHLLTEILREEWGFDGFVMSDFVFGIRDIAPALKAGLDLEMPMRWRGRRLPQAIANGSVTHDTVRTAAFRTLRAMFRACARTGAAQSPKDAVRCEEHLALARETARRSFVLLKNNPVDGRPVLPIVGRARGGHDRRVALIGRLAALPNTGDRGSSSVRSPHVVTAAEGIEALAATHGIRMQPALSDNLAAARRAAADADAAIVIVGNTWREEGEYVMVYGGDRATLSLPPRHEQLIKVVAGQCARTIVVLVGGGAFVCQPWLDDVPAMMMAWYAGAQGGHALAEVLLGEHAPSGRLPCTWPAREDQLPPFSRRASEFTYGPLHGYRLFHARHDEPAFWFGHGLGYGRVTWHEPALRQDDSGTVVEVPLRNSASFPQREVVQVYMDLALGTHPEPLPTLAGFDAIDIPAEEDCVARVRIDEQMRRRAANASSVYVGPSAGDLMPVPGQL